MRTLIIAVVLSIYTMNSDRKQKKVETLIQVYEFLHDPEFNAARSDVRKSEDDFSLQDPSTWKVMSSFNYAGNLVKNGALAADMFFDYGAVPLLNLRPSFDTVRDTSMSGNVEADKYYRDFYWLLYEAKRRE